MLTSFGLLEKQLRKNCLFLFGIW